METQAGYTSLVFLPFTQVRKVCILPSQVSYGHLQAEKNHFSRLVQLSSAVKKHASGMF